MAYRRHEGPKAFAFMERRRKSQRHTLSSLAAACGCSVGTLSRVEAGKVRPSAKILKAIAAELDVSWIVMLEQAPLPPRRTPAEVHAERAAAERAAA